MCSTKTFNRCSECRLSNHSNAQMVKQCLCDLFKSSRLMNVIQMTAALGYCSRGSCVGEITKGHLQAGGQSMSRGRSPKKRIMGISGAGSVNIISKLLPTLCWWMAQVSSCVIGPPCETLSIVAPNFGAIDGYWGLNHEYAPLGRSLHTKGGGRVRNSTSIGILSFSVSTSRSI